MQINTDDHNGYMTKGVKSTSAYLAKMQWVIEENIDIKVIIALFNIRLLNPG